jgi:hypothetical protein
MDNDFYLLLELAYDNKPLSLGNVEFWKDNDDWCYSIPKTKWEIPAITRDLCKIIKDKMK